MGKNTIELKKWFSCEKGYKDFAKIYEKVDGTLVGNNNNGETVILDAFKDDDGNAAFRLETLQYNGWSRFNVFYADGTEEEYYEK